MAEQRSTIEFTVDGLSIAALTAEPAGQLADPGAGSEAGRGKPLIAALHGGTYTARYFDVAGSPQGTFMDLAAAAGYPVVSFDRPGDSSPATVEQFAKLLTAAPFVDASIARATGHSIDHHILGHALHLRQLAFAEECQLWASQPS